MHLFINSIHYDRAFELELQLTSEISQLMQKAEKADSDDDNDQLKGDLKRLKTLKENVKEAQEKLEEQERTKPTDQIKYDRAQAVVDAEGSQLEVGARVTNTGTDRNELVENIDSIPEEIGMPEKVLADNGYVNEGQVEELQENREKKVEVFLPVSCEGKYDDRKHDFRPQKATTKKSENPLPWKKKDGRKNAG